MHFTLLALVQDQLAVLPLMAAGLPDASNLFTNLLAWVVKLIGSAAALFLAIDLARQLFSSRRDLVQAGKDALTLAFLLLLITQATSVITTLQSWIGG